MSYLIELLQKLVVQEQFTESKLPGVRFFSCSSHIPRTPLLYNQGIFIVAQGTKIGHLGESSFQYDANNYLVTSVPIPFECETFATEDAPFYGIYIDIDMETLHELVALLQGENHNANQLGDTPKGVGPAKLDNKMTGAVERLLECLLSESEATILGPSVVKEIVYRALCGTQAASLYALAAHDSSFSKISLTLRAIHKDYAAKLDVDGLAQLACMSVSTFHRAFKEVTSESPIQYLKKIRLNKARSFIEHDQVKAYIAADMVGYESASQFSREFKRYFGKSPAQVARESRLK